MNKEKIIGARLRFLYKGDVASLLTELRTLLKSELEFARMDPTENVEYYGGESLGFRYFLEIGKDGHSYGFSVMNTNSTLVIPAEVVDLSFHFKRLLASNGHLEVQEVEQ